MNSRHGRIHGHNLHSTEGLFQPTAAPSASRCLRFEFDAKPQFGKRDRTDRDGFRGSTSQPGWQVEVGAFVRDQERTVQD